MGKLYVFAIGGTGARVLRSLTMLLASGVKSVSGQIVPIIIDPDAAAADKTRAVELMKTYGRIHNSLTFSDAEKNHFFEVDLSASMLPIANTSDKKYAEFIDLDTMSRENKAFMQMLFSQDNLSSDMSVGFKGNPNVGSVVLNQFAQSDEFRNFLDNFQQGDKIFIVSSIFGGTGASGFPLLLKTLRDKNSPKAGLLSQAVIGAISVLPYFGLAQDDSSVIDSNSFVSKARSALAYYSRNVSGNNSIDYLYYVADEVKNSYQNSEGGFRQQNSAHIVEMLAALAILDFDKHAKSRLDSTKSKEFGLASDSQDVSFANFATTTKGLLQKPLTQMMLFARFRRERVPQSVGKQPWSKILALDGSFFGSDEAEDVRSFLECFLGWLGELEGNKRSFAPFELVASDPVAGIRGVEPSYPFFLPKKGHDLIDAELNKLAQGENGGNTSIQKFMDIVFEGTLSIVTNTLKMN